MENMTTEQLLQLQQELDELRQRENQQKRRGMAAQLLENGGVSSDFADLFITCNEDELEERVKSFSSRFAKELGSALTQRVPPQVPKSMTSDTSSFVRRGIKKV